MQSNIRTRAISVMEFIKWIMTSIYDDEIDTDDWNDSEEEDYDYCANGCRFY